jgi:hypothetical protein
MHKDENYNNIDFVLTTLWVIGFIVAVILISTIVQKGMSNSAPLIGAFAILISAGIASASVMKSIYATKQNDKEKGEKEKERKRIFALNVMKTIHTTLEAFSSKVSPKTFQVAEDNSKSDFDTNLETINKLIDMNFSEHILPYLPEKEQKVISTFYSEFYRFISAYEPNWLFRNTTIPTTKNAFDYYKYATTFKKLAKEYIDINTIQEQK